MKKALFIFIIALLFVYGFFIEPNMLVVKNYKIHDNALKGIKIVFVSDLHIKPNQSKRLNKIVKMINGQQPDIVLSAGDFVSGHNKNMTMSIEDIAEQLKNVRSKYGFYTVLGNHDNWVDGEGITDALTKSGIRVLANSNVKININGKDIYIAGVEDEMTGTPDIYSALYKTKNPVILLTHSPSLFPEVPKEVNLTLSGHTHGGQIKLPFLGALIVASDYENIYSVGLFEEEGRKMIVTKGIGNSILNVRFNCVPEIVVIKFE